MRSNECPPLPTGFQAWLKRQFTSGEAALLLKALAHGEPRRGARLVKLALQSLQQALPDAYPPVPWADGAFFVSKNSMAGSHPLHAAGAYYLQEPSAMAAVGALDLSPGQRVLDLCAAPGGKTGQIAAKLQGQGLLVCNEPIPARARILSHTVERLGIVNALVLQETPERLEARFCGCFDRILVDAPCSGEGMFRRDPQTRLEWSERHVVRCAERQRSILRSAAPMLRPGGLLVYSTCTFNALENDEVVADFLSAHSDFAAEDFALPGLDASQDGKLLLCPHRAPGEGQFIARLRHCGAGQTKGPAWTVGGSVAPASVLSFLGENLPGFSVEGNFRAFGETLCLLPREMPSLAGLYALRAGLELGRVKPRHFQPAHALALALVPGQAARHMALSEAEARAWLSGQGLPCSGIEGWTLIVHEGVALGFGKGVDGLMKNHMPYKLPSIGKPGSPE